MKNPFPHYGIVPAVAIGLTFAAVARADWQRSATDIAWRRDGQDLWRFSFDPAKGKPFFHPLSTGGPAFTNFKPDDHPWHYGLWFSWKYINRVNYWEENRQSGRAEGSTRWSTPRVEARPNGSAEIHLDVTYQPPSGRTELSEKRVLSISAPAPDGSYTIDWSAHFVAGSEGALLDRTPMPGEPNGRLNGGYAGLSIRMSGAPLAITFLSTEGPVTNFPGDRARPDAAAVACNFMQTGRDVGGVAILSAPENAGENPPWYLINSAQMRFACAAILAPKPRSIPPQGEFVLRYRIEVRPTGWTPAALKQSLQEWRRRRA